MVSYKQMKYCESYEEMIEEKRPVKILCDGIFKGYRYIILDINGRHPTAYIEIPTEHPCYGKTDKDVWFLGSNEITYGKSYLRDILSDTWVIGWDYGHIGQYTVGDPYGKKYRTYEILMEVFEGIEYLIEENFSFF